MYYVNFDNDGNIIGFYTSEIHTSIPEPNIEITEEQHDEYFAAGQLYKVINGQWTYVEPVPPTLEEVKAGQLAALEAEYEPRFKELQLAWAAANLADNTDAAASVRAEYTTLMSEYQSRREGITNAV